MRNKSKGKGIQDITMKECGRKPQACTAFSGEMDTVSLLLDRGADINMVGGEYGLNWLRMHFKGNAPAVDK